MESTPRVKELDSIRGLAALAIVVYHLWLIQVTLLGAAVDLFFVLSGYLITSILLNHPPSERFMFAFYARRGLRIWPIYYLSLFFVIAVNHFVTAPGSLDGLPYFLTFSQGLPYYWAGNPPDFITAFRHTWSLAIEEQFYIIWPALLWLLGKKCLPWAATAMVVLAVCTRISNMNPWILVTHCDGLALGALLAGWLHASSSAATRDKNHSSLLCLGTAAAAYWVLGGVIARSLDLASYPNPGFYRVIQSTRVLGLNMVFFALVGLTIFHAGNPRLRALRDQRLVYLGKISYGIYLYHHIVFVLVDEYMASHRLSNNFGCDLIKIGMSLAIAALSYRYVERPILKLKELFPYFSTTIHAAERVGDLGPIRAVETG